MMNTQLEALDDNPRLPANIAGLNLLTRPIWVFDPVTERKLFANASAVMLWGADDLSSLLARNFSAKSDAARIRTETTFAAVKSGGIVSEVWTFYPNGQPVSVDAIASHLALTDGSSAILFEAVLSDTSAEHLRALEAIRHAQTIVSLYDNEGREVFGNPVSEEVFGARKQFSDRFADAGEAEIAWRQVTLTGAYRDSVLRQTEAGRTWHDMTLQETKDPVTGGLAILAYESDGTAQVETEANMANQAVALTEARELAEAANRAKSEFLANMSHEIRTPLNGVVSLAELLCQSTLTSDQREAAELIRSSGRSLEMLLADILHLSRIEAGEVTLTSAPFDLADLATDVTDLLRLKAEEKGVELRLRVDLAKGAIRCGDGLRVRQILTNLVSNAVKFTGAGTVMAVIRDQGDGVRLEVEDTGIGFAQDQKSRIFERFQQADGSITRQYGGAGLGLAITAQLVSRMGGQMDCMGAPGEGAKFWVDLPLPVGELAIEDDSPAGEDFSFEGLEVLVADDHPVNRRVLEMILTPLGADVVAVENGALAVEATEKVDFDVVLMDMQMPVMDGLAATRCLVAAGGPPVIMVSANALPEHREAALAAGAVSHVVKPIEPGRVIEEVARVVVEARSEMATRTSAARTLL